MDVTSPRRPCCRRHSICPVSVAHDLSGLFRGGGHGGGGSDGAACGGFCAGSAWRDEPDGCGCSASNERAPLWSARPCCSWGSPTSLPMGLKADGGWSGSLARYTDACRRRCAGQASATSTPPVPQPSGLGRGVNLKPDTYAWVKTTTTPALRLAPLPPPTQVKTTTSPHPQAEEDDDDIQSVLEELRGQTKH